MTDYMIVASPTAEDLETAVVLHINAGWEPIGGLCLSVTDQEVWFYQAMTYSK